MLSAHDVSHTYRSTPVLLGVDFALEEGAITGLIGANGAGKTTLLHILVGLLEPSAGSVIISETHARTRRLEDRIGFCPDDLPQVELLTGREYLDFAAGMRRLPRQPAATRGLLAGMRLQGAADRLVSGYSHGMKRKLQLVAALLHLPEVLILDEPFRGLDPESSAIIKTLLTRYARRGNTVLISTHDLLVAEQMCDRILVLGDGRVLAHASVEALQADRGSSSLEESFLRLTGLDETAAESSERFFVGLDKLDRADADS